MNNPFRLSVRTKLIIALTIIILLVSVLLFVSAVSMTYLTAMRAHIGGESTWSKGQKDAVYYLDRYTHTKDEADYERFRESMKVMYGIRAFFTEAMKEEGFNASIARQGLIDARISKEDLDDATLLVRVFRENYYIKGSFDRWKSGDDYLERMDDAGERLHEIVKSGNATVDEMEQIGMELASMNAELTPLEYDFSDFMGEASRWLRATLMQLMAVVTIIVIAIITVVYYLTARSILSNISGLREGTLRVGKGDFTKKIDVRSKDELGSLSESFNRMMDELSETKKKLEERTKEAEKAKTQTESKSKELFDKNAELEKFNKMAIGRELKMVELKKKIEELEGKKGRKAD